MTQMAVTVATGTLRPCSGVSPVVFRNRRLVGWRPLASAAAPAKLRLSSPALRVPRVASPVAVEDGSSSNTDTVPTPKVIIDQDSDPDATIVEVTLGDRLGDLLATMGALRNLGLNVVKASVCLDSSGKHNNFAITKSSTGRKIDDPELLEAVRLIIINNMLEYHPEASSKLAMGATFGLEPPPEADGHRVKKYRGMGSLEAMTKGSDARYLGDTLNLKVAQGVVGAVANKGFVLRFIPYTMHAVKQGFQDVGASSLQSAHDLLRSETLRLRYFYAELHTFSFSLLDFEWIRYMKYLILDNLV